jgi:uncharacterized protein (DUF2141 family)
MARMRLHGTRVIRAASCALVLALPARAATIIVTVAGIRSNHGHVRVAICPKAMFLEPHCPWFGNAPAQAGNVHVVIAGVPAGTYAAEAFHDEDNNGKVEQNFLGMPEEGMGFSNDAPMRFGPPAFGAASFDVGDKTKEIRLSVRYYN